MSNFHLRPKGITHCQKCGKELTARQRSNRQAYCCRLCAGMNTVPICRCETCGRTFRPISVDRMRHCSKKCAALNREPRVSTKDHWPDKACKVYFPICPICNKPFMTRTKAARLCNGAACIKTDVQRRYKEYYKPVPKTGLCCIKCLGQFESYDSSREYCQACSAAMAKASENRRRRARLRGSKRIETVHLEVLFDRDRGRCKMCRRKLNMRRSVPHPMAATVDHIIPLAEGGEHNYRNTQLACFRCNYTKSAGSAGGEQLLLYG